MKLSEIFYWLLSMSITANICAIPVLLLRLIPKIPKNIIRHMWIVPFLRFVFPFGLPSRYGLMELTAKLTRTVAVPIDVGEDTRLLTYNHIALAQKYIPFTWKTDMVRRVFDIAGIIWLTVAVFTLLVFAVTYIKTAAEQGYFKKAEGNIRYSMTTDSPFLLGVIRPLIILPYSLTGSNNSYIIRHEQCHMRALDNFSRILAILVCILHWFNPLVWLLLKQYIYDLECACDERVIKNCTEEQKKEYARVLVASGKALSPAVSGIGSSVLSKRINGIFYYRRLSAAAIVFLICIFAAIAYILLSNGEAPNIQ